MTDEAADASVLAGGTPSRKALCMTRTHQVTELFTVPSVHRPIHLMSSPDARRIAYTAKTPGNEDGHRGAVVWDGRIVAVAPAGASYRDLQACLSPDGSRLAIMTRDRSRGGRMTVALDDGREWKTELTTIHYNGWLDQERFVWEGWTDDRENGKGMDDAGIRYFVNGDETTGRIEFHGVCDSATDQHGLDAFEDGYAYTAWSDGERTPRLKVEDADDWRSFVRNHRFDGGPLHETPQVVRADRDRPGPCRISYCGAEGKPLFEEVSTGGGVHTFSQDGNGDTFGYVGVRYPGWAMRLGSVSKDLMERAEDHLERTGKEPFWAMAFAYLYSPYTPLLHPLIESSKRYHVVHARLSESEDCGPILVEDVWRKGYPHIIHHRMLPTEELLAVTHDGRHMRVVIDEVEGPAFDEIWNVRVLSDASTVAYVARHGDVLCTVTVR